MSDEFITAAANKINVMQKIFVVLNIMTDNQLGPSSMTYLLYKFDIHNGPKKKKK